MEHELRQIRAAIRKAETDHVAARAAANKTRDEMRASGADFTKDRDAFTALDEAYRSADALRDEVTELRQRENRLMEIAGERRSDADVERDLERKERAETRTMADRFLRSAEYENLRNSGVLEMAQARVNTLPIEVATREEALQGLRMRTTVDNAAGSGGGLIWSDRTGIVVPMPVRSIRLLDVITVGTTDSDTIEWAAETTLTDAAAETPYGTAAPEAAYGWTKRSTVVKRIPHFVPATKGALADGGQLRTLLESRLMRGVRLRIERQALKGDGIGDNLTGIENTAGLGTVALGTDTRFDAVHKAITNVRVNYLEDPTAILIHPNDYEQVVLEKDADGNYVHGRAASESSVATIWGLAPVVTTLATEGTPIVADFSEAVLWMRAGVSVAASDSHSDFFVKGLVALLAEARAAFAVLEPKAFCKLTGF